MSYLRSVTTAIYSSIALFTLNTPGIAAEYPNQSFTEEELWLPTHTGFLKGEKATGFQNQPHAHGGYVIVAGNGTHMALDITDPYNPVVHQVVKSPYRTVDLEDQHDQEQEGHTVSFAKYPDGSEYMVTIAGKGVDIWDVSDITAGIEYVRSVELPGINYGDVDGAIWGVGWQGNYIYIGATNNGLYVIDATDPTQPVDAVSPESPDSYSSVPISNWDGIKVGQVFPIGNLLPFGTPKVSTGLVTLDIQRPGSPITLDTAHCDHGSYITWFYGKWFFCQAGLSSYDVTSDPGNITHVATPGGSTSEYLNFGDDYLFEGNRRPYGGVTKYDITDPANPVKLGKVKHPVTQSGDDDQFSVKVGNLLVVADDENDRGSFVAVHDTAPDTKPPRVMYANPVNGDSGLSPQSRVGVSFSDQIDLRTVDTSTFIVREVGGSALPGYFGINHTVVNFSPVGGFKPNTTYEVVLPQGGIKDLVGNGLQTAYTSQFSTGEDASQQVTFEAEDAVLSGGAVTATNQAGYSADGFVDYPSNGGSADFILPESFAGGVYMLNLRFANGSTEVRKLDLVLNGTSLNEAFSFEPTGSWTAWSNASRRIVLASGTQSLSLSGLTSTAGPNLDYIELVRLGDNHSMEAEDGTVSDGTTVQSSHSGFVGSGFADFPTTGGRVDFVVDNAAAGTYTLSTRYAVGSGSTRFLSVEVNGNTVTGSLSFTPTGDWGSWEQVDSTVTLLDGKNTVSLVGLPDSPGPNVDNISLKKLGGNSALQAEDAILSGGITVASGNVGYIGTGYADYPSSGGEATFLTNVDTAGNYNLDIRYANGASDSRYLAVEVNGVVINGNTEFTPHGWTSWQTLSRTLTLDDGPVTVTLRGLSTPGPNIDQIFLSAGSEPAPLACSVDALTPIELGQSVNFNGASEDEATFAWNFGDGTTSSDSTASGITHTYSDPGRYNVLLTVKKGARIAQCSAVQIVHNPLTSGKPSSSSSIIVDENRSRVWVVNSDSNTVTAINADSSNKEFEVAVGLDPRTLALANDGSVWVTNYDNHSISVLDGVSGQLLDTVALPYGSQPFGIVFSPNGNQGYVALQATGQLVELDPVTRSVSRTLDFGPDAAGIVPMLRGVAVSADSSRVFVTRFVSPSANAEVYEVNASSFSLTRTFALANDLGEANVSDPDNSFNSRGVPNYLSSVVISPDGKRAWMPSKKDNVDRGLFKDGRTPSFESTTRTIISPIDLVANTELADDRVDFNDSDSANAAVFSQYGDLLFVALQGSNEVAVVDANQGTVIATLMTEAAPQGLALSNDGKLYVNNFLSRSVSTFDVNAILNGGGNVVGTPKSTDVVANELLSATVLEGKKIFYQASDLRMSNDGYLSCASCHLDGGSDHRVFDFTNRGEGLRNTTTLRGRKGTGHGPVHWTGNFDEIHDFEHDMRANFGGRGFLSDDQFNTGTRNQPLGDPKAGVNASLDALSAYVTSLADVPPSPLRDAGGMPTADALAGKAVYDSLNCSSCHSGPEYTDSALDVRHDVGTLTAGSGQRLGASLDGIDTPTLKGVWNTAPYLHDGSANTLYDVINNSAHGNASSLSQGSKDKLVAFLLQLDDSDAPLEAESAALSGGAVTASNHGGYSGSGFVDYPSSGGEASFSVNADSAGSYVLAIRYANGGGSNRSLNVEVNGSQVSTVSFAPSGSWATWKVELVEITLNSGANTVSLVGLTSSGGPNVDAVTVRK